MTLTPFVELYGSKDASRHVAGTDRCQSDLIPATKQAKFVPARPSLLSPNAWLQKYLSRSTDKEFHV